ncbi:MAG: hypothetical protein GWP08_06825 [Nitrospiraceae bacterium]|nr:hypothetical protein [Nitrospiraceae bacterium]
MRRMSGTPHHAGNATAWTALLALLCLITPLATAQDAPPLPPGLGAETTPEAPALPPGLGGGDTPALPPGLGEPGQEPAPEANEDKTRLIDRLPFPLHGYWDARAAVRTRNDAAQPDDSPMAETRLQLKTEKAWGDVLFEFTGDVYLDAARERAYGDLRSLRLTWSPVEQIDIRAGRQVLTWGTGDMLFINDLFPKDWQSFFIGRDVEYLKAPADAVRVGWFNDLVNIEVVYTPQFAPDRYITGERISYWNPLAFGWSGEDGQVNANPPSAWFENDEVAVRLYRSVGAYELAFYGYSGYWKSPGGQRLFPMQATFPKLRVYGASLRGKVGKGIGNIEFGYYDSYQDRSGTNPLVNNSELRLLVGYEQEIAKEFTGAVQYYLEHMMDYDAYMDTRIFLIPARDKDRHVLTLRLTKLMMNQNLTLSLFTYYSPSDGDAYLRPNLKYKVNDHWTIDFGGNVFAGESDTSFFGQFKNNSNVYAGFRYAF